MNSRIWRLAGVGLLGLCISAASMADDRSDELRGSSQGGQRGQEGRPGGGNEQRPSNSNQQRPQNNQPPQQQQRPAGNEQRPGNEHRSGNEQRPGNGNQPRPEVSQPRPQANPGNNELINSNQPWQSRPPRDPNVESRPPQQPANNLPIQSRPDTVRQTQDPLRGNYQDIPRRHGEQQWQTGNRPGDYNRPDNRPDNRWPGRPNGHGNGWGPGPQYRPGVVIDRFPDREYRVPYRGQDYFYSGGYWYRPQGPRYVVVTPPRGIRVSYLPDYAREVWIGSSLFFLAAGAYYLYQEDSQQYVVVDPPVASAPAQPQQTGNGYDVEAYPANGQSQAQIDQDRYDCYRYAVQQSNFDPATVTYAPDASVVQIYRQAEGGCLSSRGYQVNY